MKYIVGLTILLVYSLVAAQPNHDVPSKAESRQVAPNSQEENLDYQEARAAWMKAMHRSEPGLNYEAIDFQTRQARASLYYAKHSSETSNRILSLGESAATAPDSFADGALSGSWAERGSKNICGRTIAADIDFDANVIYIASAMGNIWTATLGNSNWTVLNDALRFQDVRMLRVLKTSKGKRLIAACNSPVAVRFSDDGGHVWTEAKGLDAPNSYGNIKRAVVGMDNTIYLVGSEWDYANGEAVSMLYRSTDLGVSFSKVGTWEISSDLSDIWIPRYRSSQAYYLKADSLFSLTKTGGLTLLSIRSYTGTQLLLSGRSDDYGTTLAICETGDDSSKVYSASAPFSKWEFRGGVTGSPFSVNSFRMGITLPEQYYFGTFDLSIWSDGRFTVPHSWTEYYDDPSINIHADIDGIDLVEDPNGNEITLVSTDGGTYLSTDRMGSATNLTMGGIRTSQYYSTYTSEPPYTINAGAQDQGFQRGDDDNAGLLEMTQVISGDYGHVTSSDAGKSVWGDYPGFAIYYPDAKVSTQNRTWNFTGTNALWLPPLAAVPNNPLSALIAGGDPSTTAARLWRLTAKASGISAIKLSYDFSLGDQNRQVSGVAFSPLDAQRIYVVSSDGNFYRSTNNGTDWSNTLTGTLPTTHYFYGTAILPSKLQIGRLWVGGSGYSNAGVVYSTDDGASFSDFGSGLPKTLVYGLASSDDERFLFAATEVGPYCCDTRIGAWFSLATVNGVVPPDMVYWSVEKVPGENTIRFGTYGRGIWDFNYEETGVASVTSSEVIQISAISLRAVPSVSSHLVRFECTGNLDQDYSISIYDIDGRLVKRLKKSAGPLEWVAGQSPSGYYTAILRSGGAVAFTKVEVIR